MWLLDNKSETCKFSICHLFLLLVIGIYYFNMKIMSVITHELDFIFQMRWGRKLLSIPTICALFFPTVKGEGERKLLVGWRIVILKKYSTLIWMILKEVNSLITPFILMLLFVFEGDVVNKSCNCQLYVYISQYLKFLMSYANVKVEIQNPCWLLKVCNFFKQVEVTN